MFKRFVVIFISFVILSGCDDQPKEVTEDMLIGQWACSTTFYHSTRYDGKGNPYDERGDSMELMSKAASNEPREYTSFPVYTKEDDTVMVTFSDKQKPTPFNFKVNGTTGWEFKQYFDIDTKTDYEYVPISKDRFKVIDTFYIRDPQSKQNIAKSYEVKVCVRIPDNKSKINYY